VYVDEAAGFGPAVEPQRAGRAGDSQPLPRSGRSDLPQVHELVAADLMARRDLGVRRYGVALQPFNGRSALRDAYEEALDLAVYLASALWEAEHPDQAALAVDRGGGKGG
jgi:hypothetical protein